MKKIALIVGASHIAIIALLPQSHFESASLDTLFDGQPKEKARISFFQSEKKRQTEKPSLPPSAEKQATESQSKRPTKQNRLNNGLEATSNASFLTATKASEPLAKSENPNKEDSHSSSNLHVSSKISHLLPESSQTYQSGVQKQSLQKMWQEKHLLVELSGTTKDLKIRVIPVSRKPEEKRNDKDIAEFAVLDESVQDSIKFAVLQKSKMNKLIDHGTLRIEKNPNKEKSLQVSILKPFANKEFQTSLKTVIHKQAKAQLQASAITLPITIDFLVAVGAESSELANAVSQLFYVDANQAEGTLSYKFNLLGAAIMLFDALSGN